MKKNNENKIHKEKILNKRIPSRKIFYYVCAIGVLATIITYAIPFKAMIIKTEELERENSKLEQQIKIWMLYDEKKEEFITERDTMLQNIKSTCDEFPADAKEEDVVMFADRLQEDISISIKNINISEPEIIYTIDEPSALNMDMDELTGEMNWQELKASYMVEGDYSKIKDVIKEIYNDKNKKGVYSITLSKSDSDNSNSNLVGNVDVSFYSLSGTNKAYNTPSISKYALGTDNIFGVVHEEAKTEEPEESEAGENTGETTE